MVHLVASALVDRLKAMAMTVNWVATVLAKAETVVSVSVSAVATMVARVSEWEQEERVYQ